MWPGAPSRSRRLKRAFHPPLPDHYCGPPAPARGRRSPPPSATTSLPTPGNPADDGPVPDRRGAYGRLLASVHHDGADVNRWLVPRGHARVYDSRFSRSTAYAGLEATAQAERRGLWRCREPGTATATPVGDGPLRLATVHADAAGDDRANLIGEHVVPVNAGDAPLDLSGWTLADEAGHVYRFPDGFGLAAGARVTVHTGAGADATTALYWGADGPVWNNDGDVVTVRDANGAVVLRQTYD